MQDRYPTSPMIRLDSSTTDERGMMQHGERADHSLLRTRFRTPELGRVIAPFAALRTFCVMALALLGSGEPARSQSFAIDSITLDPGGRPILTCVARTDSYYRLLRGNRVTTVGNPVALALGVSAAIRISDPSVPGAEFFYRVQQIPLSSPLDSDGDGIDDVWELTHGSFLHPLNPADADLDPDGDGFSHRDEYLAGRSPLATIVETSPLDGESGVSVTRETVVRFGTPLAPTAVVGSVQFHATVGARRLLTRVGLSEDRRTATLFYLEPLPGGTRIYAAFDGTGLSDVSGRPLDPDGDGQPGGVASITFDTASLTPISGTAVIGRIFRSDLAPGVLNKTNVVEVPLAGVQIEVIGAEESLRTRTDAMGNFTLAPCPVGRFFVRIDGRTATNEVRDPHLPWSERDYYPVIEKAWQAVAGRTDNLAGCPPGVADCQGLIYLPMIRRGTLQPVSATEDTVISFPAEVIAQNPELAGVSLTVPPNALVGENGVRGGRIGIAPVSPDRLPEPLPPGLTHVLDISIQTDGPQNFDRPVPVRFPNLPDPVTGSRLPPGAKSALWSYNHDKGGWEIVGPMTVTADGLFVESDPGFGVRQPGWHSTFPGVSVFFGPFLFPSPPGPCIGPAFCVPRPGWDPQEHHNGCGAENGALNPPELIFHDACNQHDIGYSTCNRPKHVTDSEFLENMLDAIGPISQPDLRILYINLAYIYYNAVVLFGDGAYEEAQAQACICDCNVSTANLQAATEHTFPALGTKYYLISDSFGVPISRGKQSASQLLTEVTLAPDREYTLSALDESTLTDGVLRFVTPTAGISLRLLPIFLRPSSSGDTDGDGLHDRAELIIGSDPHRADTDNDGIPDGVEVRQGTDPLDGRPARTGILASTSVPGTALDVCTLNDIVVVAGGSEGVSVFNVFTGLNPVRVVQVDTPGSAQRVSGDGTLLGVADGAAGVAVIDITDPPNATVRHQVNLGSGATAVASAGGFAFVGTGAGEVVVVEMSSGYVLDRVRIFSAVQDLVVAGDALIVLAENGLHLLSLGEPRLRVTGSLLGVSGNRVSAGNGLAYVAGAQGHRVVEVTDPTSPRLVRDFQTAQPNWRHLVSNGSGLGLAVVAPFQDADVYLQDLRPGGRGSTFLTSFPTPGNAVSVSIFKGLAYVADAASGLQVINYQASDANGVPPAIALATTFRLDGPTSGAVEEGRLARVTANVSDDVQIRNVEFFVDDERVATDGSFPFEHRWVVPALNAARPNFRIRARATDTGGNATWSETITVTVTPDRTGPRVVRTFPARFDVVGSARATAAFFGEPIDPATLHAGTFELLGAGPDLRWGTGDDLLVTGGDLRTDDRRMAAFLNLQQPLAPGLYRGSVRSPLADVAGNLLNRPESWEFWVLGTLDADQDGLPDELETALGFDPSKPDTHGNGVLDGDEDADGDGLSTRWEILLGYDPLVRDTGSTGERDGDKDRDLDMLSDLHEIRHGLNPFRIDSDEDGWDDASELREPTSPLDSESGPVLVVGSVPVAVFNGALEPIPAMTRLVVPGPVVSVFNGVVEEVPPNTLHVYPSAPVAIFNAGSRLSVPGPTAWLPDNGIHSLQPGAREVPRAPIESWATETLNGPFAPGVPVDHLPDERK